MGEAVAMCAIILVCAGIFIGIGVWALVRKTPMHFWSGSTVHPEEIRDIAAYNRANGIMWLVFGSLYVGLALLSFVSVAWASIGLAAVTLGGIPVLILIYRRIYDKYRA